MTPHEEELERALNAVRALHHNGDDGLLAPGKWCVEDGQVWPCKTARALGVRR